MSNMPKDDYGVVIFKEGTPPGEKRKGVFFFIVLSMIIVGQACYWIFANTVEPIILGMPFGLFTVVLLIILEFIALAAMYAMEPKEKKKSGDVR